jgi:hypothetical protein
MPATLDRGPGRDEPGKISGFGAHISESKMSEISLKLEFSTLKAVVVLFRLTGQSLQRSLEDGRIESHDRCAIFARWMRARRDLEEAEQLLLDLSLAEIPFVLNSAKS